MAIIASRGVVDGSTITLKLPENSGEGTIVSAFSSDNPAQTITNIIEYGDDTELFSINSDMQLVYHGPPRDFETMPEDLDLTLLMIFYDPTTHAVTSQMFTTRIEIENVVEAPYFVDTSNARVDEYAFSAREDISDTTQIGSIKAFAPDGGQIFYSIVGPGADMFEIDAITGVLTLLPTRSLDHESNTAHSLTLSVVVADATGVQLASVPVEISVVDLNDNPPEFTSPSEVTIDENSGANQIVYTARATADLDGDTVSYALNGQDEDFFTINAETGEVYLTANPDFETKSSYSFTIKASTGSGDSLQDANQQVTLTVNDVNDAPEIHVRGRQIIFHEGIPTGGVKIGPIITATDLEGDAVTVSLDDPRFFLSKQNKLYARRDELYDYETESPIKLTITATDDNGLSSTKTIEIALTDLELAPIFTSGNTAEIDENSGENQPVYTAAAIPDIITDTVSYSLNGVDGDAFTIDSTTGVVTLNDNPDFESKSSYSFTIKASVGEGVDIIDSNRDVTLHVGDIDEKPTLMTLSRYSYSLKEGEQAALKVAELSFADDALGVNAGRLGAGNPYFEIRNSDELWFKGGTLDHETDSYHGFYIYDSSSGTGSPPASRHFRFYIGDVDISMPDLPDKLFNDRITAGTQVGDANAVVSGGSAPISYSLSGAHASLFQINASTGVVTARSNTNPTETTDYQLTVTAALGNGIGETVSQSFTVTVNEIDVEGSEPIAGSWNRAISRTLETDKDGDSTSFRVIDAPDYGTVSLSGNRYTYTPATGFWGEDNFTIRATDAHGLSDDVTVEATINPVADAGYRARIGTHGNNTLIGGTGQDHFFSGRGNDIMKGLGGRDKYTIERYNGFDTIYEVFYLGTNILEFKGIVPDGQKANNFIQTDWQGNDLVIGISNTPITSGLLIGGTGELPTDNRVRVKNWNADKFDTVIIGDVTLTGRDFASTFHKDYNPFANICWFCYPPITLDIGDDGLDFIDSITVPFDWDGDGTAERSAWVGPQDGLLAYDKNSDGLITDADEVSFISYLEGAETDLEALAAFDSHEDGWLDAADTEFAKFKVWQDANSNGVSDPGEVLTLAAHDITRIRLSPDPDSGEQLQHVKINATGVYVTSDGVEHLLGDVSFSHDGSEHHTPPDIL